MNFLNSSSSNCDSYKTECTGHSTIGTNPADSKDFALPKTAVKINPADFALPTTAVKINPAVSKDFSVPSCGSSSCYSTISSAISKGPYSAKKTVTTSKESSMENLMENMTATGTGGGTKKTSTKPSRHVPWRHVKEADEISLSLIPVASEENLMSPMAKLQATLDIKAAISATNSSRTSLNTHRHSLSKARDGTNLYFINTILPTEGCSVMENSDDTVF